MVGRQITVGPGPAGITIAVQVLTGSYGMPRPGIRHAAAAARFHARQLYRLP